MYVLTKLSYISALVGVCGEKFSDQCDDCHSRRSFRLVECLKLDCADYDVDSCLKCGFLFVVVFLFYIIARSLFYGEMKESREADVELKCISAAAFKRILGFLYTGKMELAFERNEVILKILGLAQQYDLSALEASIIRYLESTICVENVCPIFQSSCMYMMPTLMEACLKFIDIKGHLVLKHETFLKLDAVSMVLCM